LTESDWVLVGKITRPHGIRGEMRVLEGSGSSGAWRQVKSVHIGKTASDAKVFTVRDIRGNGKFVILSIKGVDDRNDAETFRGLGVFVARNVLPKDDDSYYAVDLIGLDVKDTSGRLLGKLVEIFENGAHEVYVVKGVGGEFLLPVIPGVVLDVDLDDSVVVDLPEGLPGLDG